MIQQGSCDCTKMELHMESIPPTMTTMQGTQWNDYHPIASLDSHHAPIEFLIPPHTEFYTDLSQAYLYIKIINSESYSKRVKILKLMQKYYQLITFFTVCSVASICISTIIDHK